MFHKKFFTSLIIFFSLFILSISSTIILPFSYKNKKPKTNFNPKLSYFESKLDNTIYTTIKIYNKEIDFHISMERYPMYISDALYKNLDDFDPSKKEPAMLYSLDQIGINRASLINKTIIVKSNISEQNEIKEVNIFRTRKFTNVSEYVKNRMGYATEEAEIGFNIVRGSQYQYVEETDNDIDDKSIQEDYLRDKEREKALEEYYSDKKQETDNTDIIKGYDPMNEYSPDVDEDPYSKRPYQDEELDDIYDNYVNTNPNSNNNGNKNNNNQNKNEQTERCYNGLFKEESANFITQLKKQDKINSYVFSIKYNNDDQGEIIIGDLPHEYSPEKYSPNNYFFDTVAITTEPPFNWHFTYDKCSYGEELIDEANMVKLSIDFGFIKGNTNLKKNLEKNFFEQNSCNKNQINDYDIYYCRKDAIKNFKPITFELQSKYCPIITNAKFEFTYEDLFVQDSTDKDRYYFQIIFKSDGLYYNWVFGKPLFKKYQMVFDQDKKTYGFYLQLNNNINNKETIIENNKTNASTKISWILVVVLFLVSLGLLYALHKLLPKLPRKLKANELEENFSYEANNKSKYNEINESDDGKKELYESV